MPTLKPNLSEYMLALIDQVAAISGHSRTATLEALLFRVEQLARHGKFDEAFGLEWVEAATMLNARGRGAKHLDPVQLAGGEEIAFDVTLLEKTAKSKSGFAGVYATTGSSFRALVPDFNGTGSRYLASRPTALQAAIDRYRYFEEHGLPYGNVGWHVEQWRSKNIRLTVDDALAIVLSEADTDGLKNPYTRAQVEAVIERRRQLGFTPKETPTEPGATASTINRDGLVEATSANLGVSCALCEENIEDGDPFAPYADGTWVHIYCRDGARETKKSAAS